jgi:acyl-homoserine lactone acylase PvdQ
VRELLPLILFCSACSAPPIDDTGPADARRVVILRDEWGVPHVLAERDADAVFGLVYARAEDEHERIERALFLGLGQNAEVLGEAGLAWDRLVHALEVPRRAQAEYARSAPEVRALCDAAARALALFRARHPERPAQLVEHVEPWHFLAADYAWHLNAAAEALGALDDDWAGSPWTSGAARDGSNAWALSGARVEGAGALLLVNPHMPLDEVYEAHVASVAGLHVSGMLAYGRGLLPLAGHNGRVGWALTMNAPDVADVFRLRFDDERDPLAYRAPDGWRRATLRERTLRVRTDAGLEERVVQWLDTHFGPVLGLQQGTGLALRVAGLERGGLTAQLYDMARARNAAELRRALERRALLYSNVIYADADGAIGYVYNGCIPRRDAALDWRAPVDGADPRAEWRGYHALAELPEVRDPECGWLQSCNSRPFSTSADSNPRAGDFPPFLVGADEDDPRVGMSRDILAGGPPFTLERLARAAFDGRVATAAPWLASIAGAAERVGLREPERVAALGEALAELAAWDGRARVDSVATTLFLLWYERYLIERGGRGGDDALLGALEDVRAELEAGFRTWRVPWGEVNRHQRPRGEPAVQSDAYPSFAVPGGHGSCGIPFTFLARGVTGSPRRFGYHGSSYVAAIALGGRPRALTVVAYGASRDPRSAHFDDQAALYARGELKPAWFSEEDVRAHARAAYHPGEELGAAVP